MLIKVVLDKQIRVFDCKEAPSIEAIHRFIAKAFPQHHNYALYYLDEDNDHISLESQEDLAIYLTQDNKKPKIFLEPLQHSAFDPTLNLHLSNKQSESVPLPSEQKQKEEIKQQEEMKPQEMGDKVEKKEEVQHPATCDVCGVDPICGDRYKCAVCPDFDLCSKCEATKGHPHALIKIRLQFQAPLSCEVKGAQEGERQKLIEERLKNSVCGKKQKLVYDSFQERKQMIISYLGSLFGEEEFSKYSEFSHTCKSDTYEDIIEEYLLWLEQRKGNMEKVIEWIKKQVAAIARFKADHFD